MLTDNGRDILTLAGLILTAAGLGYTIYQVHKTKSAARAAEEAARKVLAESRDRFYGYIISTAFRLVREVQIYLQQAESVEWAIIALRLEDLAEQIVLLSPIDQDWPQVAQQLREWSAAASTQSAYKKAVKFDRTKSQIFYGQFKARLDALHGPFNM